MSGGREQAAQSRRLPPAIIYKKSGEAGNFIFIFFDFSKMAKLTDILDVEKRRTTPESHRKLYLWADGTFFRAYEWSAWLCVRYIKQFKVTKRMVKSVGADMLFVGFPQTSLDKFLPQNTERIDNDDKSVTLTLPPDLVCADEGSTLENDFQNWRTAVPLVEGKNTDSQGAASVPSLSSPMSMTGIFKEVLNFPIEQKSPIDSMLFLADVKRRLSSLL